MCARLAYPNGLARLLVTATSASGKRIADEGMTGGTAWPLGVDARR